MRLLTILLVLYITFIGGTAFAHVGAIPDSIRLIFMAGPIAIWLVSLIRHKQPFPRTPLDAPLLVGVIWLFLTALLAQDRRISLEMLWPFLLHILAFYMLVDLMRRGWASHFQAALLAVALTIIAISIVELALWFFSWDGAGFFPPLSPKLDLALGITTIQGNYIAVLLPLILVGVLLARHNYIRLALAATAFLLFLIEILTFSRGGLLGAFVAGGLLFAFGVLRWQRRTGRRLFQPWIILTGMLLAVVGASLLIVVWTATGVRSDSDEGRLDIWRSAIEMTRDHPLNGIGPGLFGRTLREYRDPDLAQDKVVSAHNLPLHVLAETGIPGFLILIWLLVYLGRVWWAAWSRAERDRRLWLEGVLAAFVAYSVHSLVDVFPLTSSVLPLLLLAAYTVPARPPAPAAIRAPRLAWGFLGALLLAFALILWLDLAQFYMTLSRLALDDNDLEQALDYADTARHIDPALSLYDLHYAYVLGRLSEKDPAYLDRAIAAHEESLKQEPTFDIGWANLAMLYQHNGQFEESEAALRRAAAINTRLPAYWLHLADPRALELNPDLAEYLALLDSSAVERYLNDDSIPLGERLYVSVLLSDSSPLPEAGDDFYSYLAQGIYAHRVLEEHAQALNWLDKAIAARPLDERAYLERAEIELERGDSDAAEQDARYARYIDHFGGAYANFILAQTRKDAATTEQLLKDSLNEPALDQYFAGTVYARPATFDYLPSFSHPAYPTHLYKGWLALADFYAQHNQLAKHDELLADLRQINPYLFQSE